MIGAPGDRIPGWRKHIGSVLLVPGGPGGLRFDGDARQLVGWVEFGTEEFDTAPSFGWSVAVGQVKRGGAAELAVGAPYAGVRSAPGSPLVGQAGRVYTYRYRSGVPGEDYWIDWFDQDDTQIGPGKEFGDRFGWSLAAGDFDADGHADLAAGAPHENVGAQAVHRTGSAFVVYGTDNVLGSDGMRITAGGGGLPGMARAEARLGMAVAMLGADLVVGIPGEAGPSALPGAANCGAVHVLPSAAADYLLHQDTPAPHLVVGVREVAFAQMPYDDPHGEFVDGPPEPEFGGEWFGWSIAS